MILASAVVQGFQHEVKSLVVGFDSHIQLSSTNPGAEGLVWSQGMLDSLRNTNGIEHVALRHERAGILETSSELQGVVIRGIDSTSFLSRIESGLIRGFLPQDDEPSVILIGQPLARKFELDTGDRVTLYIVSGPDDIRPRPMRVSGIYETGLLEFDLRHVWTTGGLLQDVAKRGAEGQVVIESTADGGARAVGQAFGSNPNGESWRGSWVELPEGHASRSRRALDLRTMPQDARPKWVVGHGALADTVRLRWDSLEGWGASTSSGSHRRVVDGYDLWTGSMEDMGYVQLQLYKQVPYDWQAVRVDQEHPEMFSWLGMLDLNVDVIVGLMVLISIVNMTSALLIILLERRSQIGLLKALGMNDAGVVRTFLWHAARILGTGFVWGNLVGLTLVWLQSTFHLVPLDPEAYYVDSVPILLDVVSLVSMEGIAFVLCVAAMVLPALWSTRIHPALTLRMK